MDARRAELGSPPAGDQVFTGKGACSACHSLDSGVQTVGPTLAGIASRAATRKPNYSAAMYLTESIVSPDAYIVEGIHGGIMPANYSQQLSELQLADLVAFPMTKTG